MGPFQHHRGQSGRDIESERALPVTRASAIPINASEPLITVAIPTYNRYEYLSEAISSAIAQSYRNIEILISNDGDEPRIEKVAMKFMEKDARVRYWKNDKNLGLAGNWNRCLDESRGQYILIMGDDDRLFPDGVERLMQGGREDIIFGSHVLIDGAGNWLKNKSKRYDDEYGRSNLRSGPLTNPEIVVWSNSIPICAALLDTALAKRVRFKEDTNTPELILFAEILAYRPCIRYVDAPVAEYRIHERSATHAGLRNEKLAGYLLDIQVSPETEPQKARLLQPYLINAVNRCFKAGDWELARKFVNSRYYPRFSGDPRIAVQKLLVILPDRMAFQLFLFAYKFRARTP